MYLSKSPTIFNAFPVYKLTMIKDQIFCYARTEVFRLDTDFNHQVYYEKIKVLDHAVIYQVDLHGKTFLQNQIMDYTFTPDGTTMLVILASKLVAMVSMDNYQVVCRVSVPVESVCKIFMLPNFHPTRLPLILVP